MGANKVGFIHVPTVQTLHQQISEALKGHWLDHDEIQDFERQRRRSAKDLKALIDLHHRISVEISARKKMYGA